MRPCRLLLSLSLLVFVQLAFSDEDVTAVVSAVNTQQLMPQFGKQLDVETAYRLQTMAVTTLLAGQRPDGFKAGLTSKSGQEKFAVKQPVAGVLLAGTSMAADSEDGYVIHARHDSRLMLELEIGFQLKEAVTRPINDVAVLKTLVKAIYPVIELPELGFQHMPDLLGTDIIANNVAARKYILGARLASLPADINVLPVKLYRNEQLILEGLGSDAMGDQWQALGWLINQSLANGWLIEPEQILITGALGKMLPAQPGNYRAHFSELGRIEWRVE
jgi:2-keto-4-pentenoate hydratase